MCCRASCFFLLLFTACQPTANQPPTRANPSQNRIDRLREDLSRAEKERDDLREREKAVIEIESNKWFDEDLRAEKIKAVEDKYDSLFSPLNSRIAELRRRIDRENLNEEARRDPDATKIAQEKIAQLESRQKELEMELGDLKNEEKTLHDRMSHGDLDAPGLLSNVLFRQFAIRDEKRMIERELSRLYLTTPGAPVKSSPPRSSEDRLKELIERAAVLEAEWNALDDKETRLLKGRTADADGRFTFLGNEGDEMARLQKAKADVMELRNNIDKELAIIRQASP